MSNELTAITEYFLELDALKLINRRTYIDDGVRLGNSAEHSWHLAMACWSISRSFGINLSEEKLLKLALVHDPGEIKLMPVILSFIVDVWGQSKNYLK